MTINTTQSRVTYAGDGVSTVFAIPFEFFLNSDITAVKTAVGGGVVTLNQPTDYTLTGAGTPTGGSATKTTALLLGETLAFFLNPPIEQESHYPANNPFPASTLENDLDRQTQISQRLNDILSRSLRAPDGDPAIATSGFALPSGVARANTFLTFDANGNPAVAVSLPGGTLSQSAIVALLNPQTPAEAAAGIVPSNLSFVSEPWYDIKRYGATLANTNAQNLAALNKAITVAQASSGAAAENGVVILIPPDCHYGYNFLTPSTWPQINSGNVPILVLDYSQGDTYDTFPTRYDGTQVREFMYTPQTTAVANFTASVGGLTSGTLTVAIPNGVYPGCVFSDSEVRSVTIAGGVNATWAGALSAGSILSVTYPNLGQHNGNGKLLFGNWNPYHWVAATPTLNNPTTGAGENIRAGYHLAYGVNAIWRVGQGTNAGPGFVPSQLLNFNIEMFANPQVLNVGVGYLAGATSATLSAPWTGATQRMAAQFTNAPSNDIRGVLFTNGSTAITWNTPLLNNSSGTAVTIGIIAGGGGQSAICDFATGGNWYFNTGANTSNASYHFKQPVTDFNVAMFESLTPNCDVILRNSTGTAADWIVRNNNGNWEIVFPAVSATPAFAINGATKQVQLTGAFSPATPAGGQQAGAIYQGAGVPSNSNGNNGDMYFRTDTPATANQRMYIKSAGAWLGIV